MERLNFYSREILYDSTKQLDRELNDEAKNGGVFVTMQMLNAQKFNGTPSNLLLCIFKKETQICGRSEEVKDTKRF